MRCSPLVTSSERKLMIGSLQSPEDNVFIDLMDFSSITADPEVGAVLCGLDMHINYKKIAKGFRYLRENEGCLFIATNLDSTFPTHGSVYPGKFGRY